jgi:hypothetical protein
MMTILATMARLVVRNANLLRWSPQPYIAVVARPAH